MSNRKDFDMMFVHSINKEIYVKGELKSITITYGLNMIDQNIYRWDWNTGTWIIEKKAETQE